MNHFSTLIRTLIACVTLTAFAQNTPIFGARSTAMGNSSVTIADVWAYQSNPGALAEVKKMAVSAAYETRFLLKEFQTQSIVYVQPLRSGVFSAGFTMNGNTVLRVIRCGLGYSLRLFEKCSAGVQLNYQGISIVENYGSHAAVTAECGALFCITENWRIGASVFNLGRAKLAAFDDERLPTKMRIGTSIQLSKAVMLSSEAEKDLNHPLRFKVGMEYLPHKSFAIRTGCQSSPISLSAGFGVHWAFFRLDFSTQYHQVLGWSPQMTFTYHAKEAVK